MPAGAVLMVQQKGESIIQSGVYWASIASFNKPNFWLVFFLLNSCCFSQHLDAVTFKEERFYC
jgi:hypothetical protein